MLADPARGFELVWATAWEDQANVLVAPVLSLLPLPVVRFPPVPFESAEKLPAIKALQGIVQLLGRTTPTRPMHGTGLAPDRCRRCWSLQIHLVD